MGSLSVAVQNVGGSEVKDVNVNKINNENKGCVVVRFGPLNGSDFFQLHLSENVTEFDDQRVVVIITSSG